MPWQQNQWIQSCNPIKLKEYLALGKPIVSTPFSELENYLDVVTVAANAGTFANQVTKVLLVDNPQKISARRDKVKNCTWRAKTEMILEVLYE